jgi:hypothetical protein
MNASTQIPNNQTTPPAWKQYYRNCNEWCRRHRNRILLCLVGLAAYEVILGAFAWHYSHSPHPLYPDPRATHLVVGITAATVLFFVLWTLFCFRFKKNQA